MVWAVEENSELSWAQKRNGCWTAKHQGTGAGRKDHFSEEDSINWFLIPLLKILTGPAKMPLLSWIGRRFLPCVNCIIGMIVLRYPTFILFCSIPKSSSGFAIQKLNVGHQFFLLCSFRMPWTEEILKKVGTHRTLILTHNSLLSRSAKPTGLCLQDGKGRAREEAAAAQNNISSISVHMGWPWAFISHCDFPLTLLSLALF